MLDLVLEQQMLVYIFGKCYRLIYNMTQFTNFLSHDTELRTALNNGMGQSCSFVGDASVTEVW